MMIDLETVKTLLVKNSETYEDDLIFLNTLSKDSLFNIISGDEVFAEYYNEDTNEYRTFNLDFDYINSSMPNQEVIAIELQNELNTVDKSYTESLYNADTIVSNSRLLLIIMISIIVLVLLAVSVIPTMFK